MVVYALIVYSPAPSSIFTANVKVTVVAKTEKIACIRQGHHAKHFSNNAILPYYGDMVVGGVRIGTHFGVRHSVCRAFATTRLFVRAQAQRQPRKHERHQTVPGKDSAPYTMLFNL